MTNIVVEIGCRVVNDALAYSKRFCSAYRAFPYLHNVHTVFSSTVNTGLSDNIVLTPVITAEVFDFTGGTCC